MAYAQELSFGTAEFGGRAAARRDSDTPARFMVPRIVLALTTFGLVAFGMLMIYSASSISTLTSPEYNYDATYYLVRQARACAVGLIVASVVIIVDYHFWVRTLLPVVWVATVALLFLVFTPFAGQDAYGASRWIYVAGFNLQPSEFAKITVILTAANIATQYYEENSLDFDTFFKLMVLGVGLPCLLIVLQPDKGTTIICALTLLVMGYLSGIPRSAVIGFVIVGFLGALILSLKDDYSRKRVLTMFNPWRDPGDAGYQLLQGFYAFGSGGLFGVGIGLSRQKYSYLPMAHNDFIFAVVGEELGLCGTLGMLAAFLALMWAGFRIARYAPDLSGRLVAAGCTSMLIIQLFVNVLGVLGIMPLTGKPVPFVSYGGSSILSCLILVGLIASVSKGSSLPETVFDARRREWGIAGGDDYEDGVQFSLVGEPTLRSERRSGSLETPAFGIASGTRSRRSSSGWYSATSDTSPESLRASRDFEETSRGRVSVDERGRRRIDLGPDASSRLRGRR